jgi:signal transduction histidine kinase
MKPNLKLWIWRDYKIPKSQGAQHITILVLTILIALVTLAELIVDLVGTNIELISALFIANLTLLFFSFKKKFLGKIGFLQIVVLYLLLELHLILLPGSFHVIAYWMPAIPVVALIFSGLRIAHIWLVVVLVTLLVNALYGINVVGETYEATIFYKVSLIGGSIFCLMIISCFSILYNLLGRAYFKLKIKNEQVTGLMQRVQEMNETLETAVASRTKNIEQQNKRLKEYAFMNSHLVRAPLANILGAIEHLDEPKDRYQMREMSSIIKKSAEDLDLVIKDVGKSLVEIEIEETLG